MKNRDAAPVEECWKQVGVIGDGTCPELETVVQRVRAMRENNIGTVRLIINLAMTWLGLTQLAPIYLGCTAVAGKKP